MSNIFYKYIIPKKKSESVFLEFKLHLVDFQGFL